MSYKYEYQGDAPQVLIEHHKEVQKKGDIVELDEPIEHALFILIPEVPKKKAKEGAVE